MNVLHCVHARSEKGVFFYSYSVNRTRCLYVFHCIFKLLKTKCFANVFGLIRLLNRPCLADWRTKLGTETNNSIQLWLFRPSVSL